MRRISHWKYLLTDRIAAFTALAMNESFQLHQKDFIMRLVVFLKKLMVSAGVSMHGKTDIIFIDPQKIKVNGEYYVGLLRDQLILECRRLYPDDNYIFQQDSAECSFTSLQIGSAISSSKHP